MWILNNERVIKRPKPLTIDNLQYAAQIFKLWTPEQLAEIGIKPFRVEKFNKKWFKSTGYTDAEVNGTVVRTYTTVPRFTKIEIKKRLYDQVKDQYLKALETTIKMCNLYEDLNDADSLAAWQQYRIDLRQGGLAIKQAIIAASTIEDLQQLNLSLPTNPETESGDTESTSTPM